MKPAEIARLTQLEDKHWWYAERRHLLRRLVRDLPPTGVALDVGAAGGGNTRVLRDLGWRVLAVEHDDAAARVASSRNVPVARADAHYLPIRGASISLLTAFDVLEHLHDDALAAREIHRVLEPGGVAVIAVPADPRLWSAHDVAVGHVRRYTRSTLEEVLSGAGLVIDRMWSWNVLLRPLVSWRRRSTQGSDLAPVPRALNLALRSVVSAERVLVLGRWPGVTLLVTAHRPPGP